MNCPECEIELSEEREYGIEIDSCRVCFGMWFDHGELEAYWRASRSTDEGPPVDTSRFEADGGCPGLVCPRCGTETVSVKRVDVFQGGPCSTCSGVWLSPAQHEQRTKVAFDLALELVFDLFDG